MRTKEQLQKRYDELESIFKDARVQWETTKAEAGRKENYWQGKKDGLRISMNLLWQEISDCD